MRREREFSLFRAGKKLLSLVVKDTVGKSVDQTVRPKPKPEPKTEIPPELVGSYNSVEAAIFAGLGINSSNETGDSPFNYGDMGGTDNGLNALNDLNEKWTDEQIAKYFVRNRAPEKFRRDPLAVRKTISAIGLIRGTQLLYKDEDNS